MFLNKTLWSSCENICWWFSQAVFTTKPWMLADGVSTKFWMSSNWSMKRDWNVLDASWSDNATFSSNKRKATLNFLLTKKTIWLTFEEAWKMRNNRNTFELKVNFQQIHIIFNCAHDKLSKAREQQNRKYEFFHRWFSVTGGMIQCRYWSPIYMGLGGTWINEDVSMEESIMVISSMLNRKLDAKSHWIMSSYHGVMVIVCLSSFSNTGLDYIFLFFEGL